MKKRFGFTLAEVLITLGIIGVVAAMTIPTLMQHINGTRFVSQYKKSLSTINQAIELAEAHYGTTVGTLTQRCNNPETDTLDTDSLNDNVVSSMCGLLNSTLAGAHVIAINGTPDGYNPVIEAINYIPNDQRVFYALADGSWLTVDGQIQPRCSLPSGMTLAQALADNNGVFEECYGFIDVNGPALPNRTVRCANPNDTGKINTNNACRVSMSTDSIGDIYPVYFHDSIVEPLTNAAYAALSR